MARGPAERGLAEAAERGAELVIHCGDITSPDVVRAFHGLEVHWVFGNCDVSRGPLELAMTRADHNCHGLQGELELDGRRLAFTHGDRPQLVKALLAERPDLVLVGHTHIRRDEPVDGVRVLCPGAIYRANPPGFALLTLPELSVEWIDL